MSTPAKKTWTWETRTYESDELVSQQVKQKKHCMNCVHCKEMDDVAYVTGDTRYNHACTVEPDGDLHFVWGGHSCKAFTWMEGKAPRAPSGKRQIKL